MRRRPEMDDSAVERRDDGGTSLHLDLQGDTGKFVAHPVTHIFATRVKEMHEAAAQVGHEWSAF